MFRFYISLRSFPLIPLLLRFPVPFRLVFGVTADHDQLWRTNDDLGALKWVLVNIAISAVFLLAVNLLETRQRQKGGGR